MPWTEEPGGLQSIGSQRFGQDWMTDTHLSFIYVCLSIFYLHSICLFVLFLGFSRQEYQSDFPFPPSVGHVLSERKLSTEEWMPLNCGVGEHSWESLGRKEIQPVHPEGNQSWVFIGRTDVEAETPILWPPHAKSWLIGKDPDAGKDWRQEEKRTTEDEMVGWPRRLDGHACGQTPGVGDGQGGLASCHPWGRRESDTTEQLNWTVFYLCLTIFYPCLSVYLLSMSFCLSIFYLCLSACLTICLPTHINIMGCVSVENAN